ncbi:universal stress protein [Caballeronia humi]|uniref:Universal stress protein family protein n=1 Tax=Caballeronia humi TaxID=326474 RepID=A0A158IMD4_9BURK|nr:universal stress protein [Caballeronia humi]SAL57718.1 universal stress protein family protein [Caballeronia humi]
MSFKSIVVHLDASERSHARMELALLLAKRFDAHLTALYAVFTPEARSFYVMAGSAAWFERHEASRRERRGAIERLFHAEVARACIKGEWVEAQGHANLAVPRKGRCADLIIAGQDDPNDPESYVGNHFPETLVMSAGRPVLLVPYAGFFATVGERVMVAWDGSREATRAVHDALPLLKKSKHVTLVSIDSTSGDAPDARIPGAEIATSIARHGVKVEVCAMEESSGLSPGEQMLSKAADMSADLIVMGGYGHARWQELVLGGATRTILASMTVPVLMSH